MEDTKRLNLSLSVVFALVVLGAFILVFVDGLVLSSQVSQTEADTTDYEALAAQVLVDADASHAEVLLNTLGCVVCHRAGVQANIAPAFTGLAERAGERNPPLSAAAYIYQSITHPAEHVVEGYNNVMPQNFQGRLTDRDLGDIVAYLLTPEAQ